MQKPNCKTEWNIYPPPQKKNQPDLQTKCNIKQNVTYTKQNVP